MDVSKEKGISTDYGPGSPADSNEAEAFGRPAQGALARKLQGRHMQMIAIGECSRHEFVHHRTLSMSVALLQVVPLVPVFSWAQALLLSTAGPAVWYVSCMEPL